MAELSPLAVAPGALSALASPFAADHHLDGRPVLPAVEAMEGLSAHVRSRFAHIDVTDLADMRFDKFLFLDADGSPETAVARTEALEDGRRRAFLETRRPVGQTAMTRVKTHAALTVGGRGDDGPHLPLDLAAALEGAAETFDAEVIYRQLVPFGPGYRNIVGALMLSADGALAEIRSPAGDRRRPVLGSPYLLDAAFHAACVWSQRHAGLVAFPVALARRRIFASTDMTARYWARVIPVSTAGATLVFDLYIHDRRGRLCEAAWGVEMRDVSGGRRRPPEWLTAVAAPPGLARLETGCLGLSLVALEAVAPFAAAALSPAERARLEPMAPRRARSFVAGRLALKRLARRLDPAAAQIPAHRLDTVLAGSPRPHLPLSGGAGPGHCSLSHDGRFAVAAAAAHPLGVDVEQRTARPLRVARLFMSPEERRRCAAGPLAPAEAALRVWSVKETVAKAAGIPLAAAWHRSRLDAVGRDRSIVEIDGRGRYEAVHCEIDEHLFTLLVLAP